MLLSSGGGPGYPFLVLAASVLLRSAPGYSLLSLTQLLHGSPSFALLLMPLRFGGYLAAVSILVHKILQYRPEELYVFFVFDYNLLTSELHFESCILFIFNPIFYNLKT